MTGKRAEIKPGTLTLDLGEANPKQALFYESRTLYTAYGGAKGGGKTHAIRTKAVGGAVRWPGIRILIVRRSYPELQQNHIEPILKLVGPEIASYNGTLHTLSFVNGSMIRFGHFQGVTAEREYQGQEYDWIFMDEATQFTEREFRYLGGCLRGVNSVPKRFYITCNPGGVGHRWVKRLFIDRAYRTGGTPEEKENPEDYTFIFASVEDNLPLMKASPAYLAMLSALPENVRRAYRYGDWNALSGAYFSEFTESVHVVKPFLIPKGWTRYRSFDYGLDMLACCWTAVDETGRCYVYREVKMPGLIVSDAAKTILECTPESEKIAATFAPPDKLNSAPSTAEQYISDLNERKEQAAREALESAYDRNVKTLTDEKTLIPETYNAARNQAAAQAETRFQSFNQKAAGYGLGAGSGEQAQAALSGALRDKLETLDTRQTEAESHIDARLAALREKYQDNLAAAAAKGDYNRLEALYEQYQTEKKNAQKQSDGSLS